MIVLGIDLSTFHLDFVRLDYDTDRADWQRYTLGTAKDAKLDRIRRVREMVPRGTWWDDVLLAGIEQPAGKHGVADVAAIYGAVLQCVPERVAVLNLRPSEWRKLCGLPGNASKYLVNAWAIDSWANPPHPDPPQDACDAYCIAWAARALNEQQDTWGNEALNHVEIAS